MAPTLRAEIRLERGVFEKGRGIRKGKGQRKGSLSAFVTRLQRPALYKISTLRKSFMVSND